MRLHLIMVLDLQSSPTVLPSALAHHVETLSSPPKHTRQYTWVEMPGIEPGSTAPSLGRNYNNSLIIYLIRLLVNLGPSYHAVWSNSEILFAKGICQDHKHQEHGHCTNQRPRRGLCLSHGVYCFFKVHLFHSQKSNHQTTSQAAGQDFEHT